jgi:hypothetical protein
MERVVIKTCAATDSVFTKPRAAHKTNKPPQRINRVFDFIGDSFRGMGLFYPKLETLTRGIN